MAVTNFFWDSSNLLQEYDDAGLNVAHYVTEPDSYANVISQRRSGEARYIHFDAIGSTMELTDGVGNVSDTRRYTAFGVANQYFGSTEFAFAFIGRAGYYCDKVQGWYYVRRRSFSSALGRWLSVDPTNHGIGASFYRYAAGNPTTFIDPSGLIAFPLREWTVLIRCRCTTGAVGQVRAYCLLAVGTHEALCQAQLNFMGRGACEGACRHPATSRCSPLISFALLTAFNFPRILILDPRVCTCWFVISG